MTLRKKVIIAVCSVLVIAAVVVGLFPTWYSLFTGRDTFYTKKAMLEYLEGEWESIGEYSLYDGNSDLDYYNIKKNISLTELSIEKIKQSDFSEHSQGETVEITSNGSMNQLKIIPQIERTKSIQYDIDIIKNTSGYLGASGVGFLLYNDYLYYIISIGAYGCSICLTSWDDRLMFCPGCGECLVCQIIVYELRKIY